MPISEHNGDFVGLRFMCHEESRVGDWREWMNGWMDGWAVYGDLCAGGRGGFFGRG